MPVERVRDGEPPSAVVASHGFSRTMIYKRIRAASQPGVGLKALHSGPATGRPRSLTPQTPLQRAYQRDPAAIEKWWRAPFPTITRQAKTAGGKVFFWDESCFRAVTEHGMTWGVKGQTSVVERP